MILGQAESDYMKGGIQLQPSDSSLLLSSSKWLNHSRLRDVVVQDCLRRHGERLPFAFLVPEAVNAFGELEDHASAFQALAAEKAKNPELAQWLDTRKVSKFTAKDVQHCAPATLGAEIRDFIEQSGLQIEFMFLGEARNDYEYLQKRRTQIHDLEHMLTGFGTDPVGETGLLALNLASAARYFSPGLAAPLNRFGAYLSATVLMRHGLNYPDTLPPLLDAISLGVQMAQGLAKPLFMLPWDDYFDRPIAELRRELNLTDAPEPGRWSWTLDACKN